jgi:hypothetical protein
MTFDRSEQVARQEDLAPSLPMFSARTRSVGTFNRRKPSGEESAARASLDKTCRIVFRCGKRCCNVSVPHSLEGGLALLPCPKFILGALWLIGKIAVVERGTI